MPAAGKLTAVEAAEGAEIVAAPGPLTWVHVRVRVPGGAGLPSSAAVLVRVALAGRVTLRLAPASTVGSTLAGGVPSSLAIGAALFWK